MRLTSHTGQAPKHTENYPSVDIITVGYYRLRLVVER